MSDAEAKDVSSKEKESTEEKEEDTSKAKKSPPSSGKASPARKKSVSSAGGRGTPKSAASKSGAPGRATPQKGGKKKDKEETPKPETPAPEEEEETGPPENVIPIFLSSKTQQIYHAVCDEDVTQDNPFKIITKEEILEDMHNRAAICDFHPLKQKIIEYPTNELLIVYDYDFKYGQNFYIALTEEAKEKLLNPPKKGGEAGDKEGGAQEEEEDTTVYKYVPPEPKDWVSMGSEKEIVEESVIEMRRRIKVSVKRKRRLFGAPCEFKDRNVGDAKDGYIECVSYKDKTFDLKKIELDKGTQVELALQQNEIMDVFYIDWLHLGDADDTFGNKADNHLKEYQSFTDLQFSKERKITCIQWHPSIKGVVAVAVAEKLNFDERIDNAAKVIMTPSLILIWSFTDPIHPQLLLEAPDDIHSFQFCPSDPNIIAGGCQNGQLVLWDISAHADRLKQPRGGNRNKKATVLPGFEDPNALKTPIVRYCAVSSIENSHHASITDILWLPDHMELNRMGVPQENKSLQCCQIFTCATDNCVLVWDTRPPKGPQQQGKEKKEGSKNPMGVPDTFKHLDLTWKPMLKVQLHKSEPGGDHAPTRFSIQEKQGDRGALHKATDGNMPDKEASVTGGYFQAGKPGSGREKRTLQSVKTHFFVGTECYQKYTNSKRIEGGAKRRDAGRLRPSEDQLYECKGTTHNTNGIIIQRDTGQQLELSTSMCRDRKRTIVAPAEPAMHYQGQKRRGPIQFQGENLDLSRCPEVHTESIVRDRAYFLAKYCQTDGLLPGWTGWNQVLLKDSHPINNDGEVVYVDWMPQKDQDTGKIQTPKPDFYHTLHDGPVTTVQRSPFFKDILLCVGGWTFSVWKEAVIIDKNNPISPETSGPILQCAPSPIRFTAGHWSPSRPSVFFISKTDGSVDVWDILDKTHEPSVTQSVSPSAITTIYPFPVSQKQHLLAVGDEAGTLHILEIPWSLRHATPNEHQGVMNYFDREVKRRGFVVQRWDFRESEKRELEAEAKRKAGIAPNVVLTDEEIEYRQKQEYNAFLEEENTFLRDLGLLKEDEPLPET